jgi:carboxymethylenebutenolidase
MSEIKMQDTPESLIHSYQRRALSRRELLSRLIAVTGSMAAMHALLESSGLAATAISERESEAAKVSSASVNFAGAASPIGAYLSMPQSAGNFPAVVVIHENRGLNEHTRDVARRFAAEGFIALAPDLLSRKGGTAAMKTPDEARAAITSLPAEDAIADLKSSLSYLDSLPQTQRGKLGAVGFCWGGARSFTLATEDARLDASVVFYGSTPPLETLAKVHCPVLGLYGETDERITSRVPETAQAMQKAGKTFEHKIYAGAGHAFFNDTGERYDAAAAADAWTRTLAFLRANLR